MKERLILPILLIITISAFGQNTGLTRGAAYRHDWAAQQKHDAQEASLDRQAYIDYILRIKSNYDQLQSQYKYKTSYSPISDGWQNAVSTNGYDLFENRQVFVSSGVVTQYLNGENNSLEIASGGRIIDEKTIIFFNDNDRPIELYFKFKVQ